MSAKLVLDIDAMQEEFFADTALIGIVSPLPSYRFCHLLNKETDMNFVRQPDMDVELKVSAQKTLHFAIYECCLPISGCRHVLYRLKCGKDTLLPEAKQLDYLWMIQSNNFEDDAHQIMQQLRAIPDVQLAQTLEPERIKNLNNLLV